MRREFIEDRVKELIADELAVRPEELGPGTRILHDLGADGMDGYELMERFRERFDVDMSEFQFGLHFGPEGCEPFSLLYRLVFARDKLKHVPITVNDLVEAAERGKWQTPNRPPV
jgi:acyl carrier protein